MGLAHIISLLTTVSLLTSLYKQGHSYSSARANIMLIFNETILSSYGWERAASKAKCVGYVRKSQVVSVVSEVWSALSFTYAFTQGCMVEAQEP